MFGMWKMRSIGTWLGLAAGIFLSPLFAQETRPVSPAATGFEIAAGEQILFLGDSITHQCLYTQYLEDFFYTRYPEKKLRFHNAGVSGDRAADALIRFEKDVEPFKPAVVTVLLGMNDGAYEDFNEATFSTYAADMEKILEKIVAVGARPIVMSPTMFDHHQLAIQMKNPEFRFRERTFAPRYNALLSYYGAWLRERSGEGALAFVDQWGPMNQRVYWRRRFDPDFTLVPDAIHPAPAGQFLMAFELVHQVRPIHRDVSAIQIAATPKGFVGAKNADPVEELSASQGRDRLAFTHTARSLPWVVPDVPYGVENIKWDAEPAAPLGVKMIQPAKRHGLEKLRVAGLASGNYELRIDGQVVGNFTQVALANQIELQDLSSTPQYRQALDVALLNRERNDVAVRPLRDAWGSIKGLRKKSEKDPDAFGRESGPVFQKIDELNALARTYEDRIHAIALPKPRRYELVRLAENP